MVSTPASQPAARPSWATWASALLWGLQFSFLVPSLGLLLVALYGATAAQVGWFLAIYNLVGLVVGIVIPAWADRRRDYLGPMVACSLLTILLTIAMWFAPSLGWVCLALVVLGAPAAVGNSLFFAQLRHVGTATQHVMDIRALVSFAWVVGMPLSTLLFGWFGARSVVLAIMAVGCLNLLVGLRLRAEHRALVDDGEAAADDPGLPVAWLVVSVMTVVYVLLQATNNAVVTVTSLFVTERLDLPVLWAGLALGLAAALEVPALMLLGRLERRFGNNRLLISGVIAGVVYYLGMTFATRPWQLLALQLPNAWFFGVITGVGLTWFQSAIPRPGLATGLYTNTRRVGSIVSGPMIAIAAVTSLGYAGVFALSAVVCLASLLVLAVLLRSMRTS